MRLQISIEKLERIIEAAKREANRDESLTRTLRIQTTRKADTDDGDDYVGVVLVSKMGDDHERPIFWR